MFLLQTKKAWTKLVSTRVVDRELRERIGRRKYRQHMEQNPSASDLGFGTFIKANPITADDIIDTYSHGNEVRIPR